MLKKWSDLAWPALGIGLVICLGILLGNSLLPLILAFALAYLVFPLVRRLEQARVNRHVAAFVGFGLALSVFIGLTIFLIPALVDDTRLFFRELPENLSRTLLRIENGLGSYGLEVELDKDSILDFLRSQIDEMTFDSLKPLTTVLKSTFTNGTKVILFLLNFFLLPVFFFYILDHFEDIRGLISGLVPLPWRKSVQEFSAKANRVLNGYFRGQILVATILSVYYGAGLTLAGLRFGFIIGILCGILYVLPFVGIAIGFTLALLTVAAHGAFLSDWVGVLLVFGFGQVLEGFYLTPKLVGDKVGLGALPTMLVLIMAGNLAGFLGLLVAIPMGGILKILLSNIQNSYIQSPFYKGKRT